MAKLEFTFVPTNAPAGSNELTLDEIPQDIRDGVEEVYAYLKTNPAGRMRTPAFADKNAAAVWQALTTAYCKVRPAGAVRFRRSPTRNLPENVIDFRITDLAADNGKDAIQDAVNAIKLAKK